MISDLYQEFKQYGFEVLGVNLDAPKDKQRADAFLKKQNITWRTIHTGEGWKTKIAEDYRVNVIPTIYLIDEEGKIIGKPGELSAVLPHLQKLKKKAEDR